MMTMDEQTHEWIATRERIAAHIYTLVTGRRIHLVGDAASDAAEASLAKLKAWQQDIDELMIDWLMPE